MSGCYALYPSSSEVVDLNSANFDRLVIQSDAVWIVEFYAPWCGHCQQFVPEYSKAATALKVKCVYQDVKYVLNDLLCRSLPPPPTLVDFTHIHARMQFQRCYVSFSWHFFMKMQFHGLL